MVHRWQKRITIAVWRRFPEGTEWYGIGAARRHCTRNGRICSASGLEDGAGVPAKDMELYMGMLGHAAFVRSDRSVFAHVHPTGSIPMAALALTQPDNPHGGHMTMAAGLPAEVSFPYGFPKPGDYRIFVQVKRGRHPDRGVRLQSGELIP